MYVASRELSATCSIPIYALLSKMHAERANAARSGSAAISVNRVTVGR
jgi:hypothetical protein